MNRLLLLLLPLLLLASAFGKSAPHKAKKVKPTHGKAQKIKPQRRGPMYTTAQARNAKPVKPAKVARERANAPRP